MDAQGIMSNITLNAPHIFGCIAVLGLCLVLSKYVMRLTDNVLKYSRYIDPSFHPIIRTVVRWLTIFISAMAAAGTLGIPITSFLALFSVVGLAVSLAVQGVLSNLAGGIIIIASKPFDVGDFIESDNVMGTVSEIGFLHTKLDAPDGRTIFLPNSSLYSSRLINYTTSGKRRVELTVNAAYGASPQEVRGAIELAASRVEGILYDPAPQVLLSNYGDNAIEYMIFVWTSAADFFRVKFELNEALYNAFRECGVEMTYPHLNVHLEKD